MLTMSASSQVGDAWAGLANMPVVSRALQTVQPSIDYAWNKYLEAHDALVTAPSYNKCALHAVGTSLTTCSAPKYMLDARHHVGLLSSLVRA
jgi:hypothetical protein